MRKTLLTTLAIAMIGLVLGLSFNLVVAEKIPRSPMSVELRADQAGPNWDLKAQMEPEHNETIVTLEDAGRPDPWSDGHQPSEEELNSRLALLQPVAHKVIPQDLRRNPQLNVAQYIASPNRVDLMFEGFEGGSVPPTGWSTTVNNAYTWEIDGASMYEGSFAASCFYDETYSGTQDEWLISQSLDLTTSGSGWVLDFYWLGSYYWSVDPNNNCDLELYVSPDGGTTWDGPVWTEESVGTFDDWTWYNTNYPLTAYLGYTDVKIAFRYSGYDGAQFTLDAISINDAAAPVGRCCYGDPFSPGCEDDMTEVDCDALSGNWANGLNCTDDPCPIPGANDDCTTAELVSGPFPATVVGNNTGALIDCPGVLDWNAVWYKFDVPYGCNNVEIDFCNTAPELATVGVVLYDNCADCDDYILRTDYAFDACGGGNPRIWWDQLSGPATYYYPVFLGDGVEQDFEFSISVEECPPAADGDLCDQPLAIGISGMEALPLVLANQYTCGRLDYYSETCLGFYDGGEDIIYELTVGAPIDVDITLDPKGTTYSGFLIDATCPADASTCIATSTSSSGSPQTLFGVHLEAGTYYIMVDTWPSPDCIPDFDLTFAASSGPTSGDDCTDPIVIKAPEDLPYLDAGQTNCGRGNNYSATCLGSYDGGEDIIYSLDISSEVTVDIILDPKGTTYSGMLLDASCPADPSTCIAEVTGSSSSPKGFYGITLSPGVYYIMIDTWPSPACVPDFDLSITEAAGCTTNDCWEFCDEIGNVVDQVFTTNGSTPDGPGGCMTSGNIWYCYTATCTGPVTVSLCGSSYDTKLAVYDGVDPNTATVICNDDFCSLQSEITFDGVLGTTYLIEVGGYSSNTGDGVISIDCLECDAPANDFCESVTPATLTLGTPVVFTGDNTCATEQCVSFPGGHVWEAFTLNETATVTLSYCGTSPPFGNAWLNLALGCPCSDFTAAGAFNVDDCGDGNVTVVWEGLSAGTYYYPVMVDAGNDAEGPYTITVVAEAVTGHCSGSGGCDEYIENITVGEINNTTGCDNYGDYTGMSTNMVPGDSYPISLTIGNGYSSDAGAIWIDWNQDFVFDVSTEAVTLDVSTGTGPYTGTVVVPGDAVPGTTVMRCRLVWNATPVPCGTTSYGEVEDYSIVVEGEAAPSWLINPEPIHVMALFSLDPADGHLYISDEYLAGTGYTAGDIDGASLAMTVKGCPVAFTSFEVLGSYPLLSGSVLHATFPLSEYLTCEADGALMYDLFDSFFDITYTLDGGAASGGLAESVQVRGHVSGDLNIDGVANISDLTMMIDWMFRGGDAPLIVQLADLDASGQRDVTDLTYFVDYLFRNGPVPIHE